MFLPPHHSDLTFPISVRARARSSGVSQMRLTLAPAGVRCGLMFAAVDRRLKSVTSCPEASQLVASGPGEMFLRVVGPLLAGGLVVGCAGTGPPRGRDAAEVADPRAPQSVLQIGMLLEN